MNIKLSFYGAAQNVTGSRYLLEANGAKILIDCGLFQEHDLKGLNWQPSPVPVDEIDCALLTHAHLDHCGLYPRLVAEGFSGNIYGTAATLEIAKIVMADCAKINEEDAEFKKKRHEKEGRTVTYPETPLYTIADAEKVYPLLQPCGFDTPFEVAEGISVTFCRAGHIFGAACIRVTITQNQESRILYFSGDVGRYDMPIIQDPAPIGKADYIICESTYGNRLHTSQSDIPVELARIINETVARGGNLIIPSFAIERTQDLIFFLAKLLKENAIPHLRIFVDSPMAVKVSDVFRRYPGLFDDETKQLAATTRMPGLTLVRSIGDSKSINHIKGTAIIIAGSGMCTGGRIKHHLASNISRPESTILFVGYQARETLGRIILSGEKKVRILGTEYDVCAKIEQLSGFSAHADRQEICNWLKTTEGQPRKVIVTHGEPEAADALAQAIQNELGWETAEPSRGDTLELN